MNQNREAIGLPGAKAPGGTVQNFRRSLRQRGTQAMRQLSTKYDQTWFLPPILGILASVWVGPIQVVSEMDPAPIPLPANHLIPGRPISFGG